MWGGGFWGTPREDEWRRRKERELQRELEIQQKNDQHTARLQQHHQEELHAKDNVLEMTRRMLQLSRSASQNEEGKMPAAKRARVEQTTDDTKINQDTVRENLMALSFAMFDTLFGSNHFQPSSFCDYLKRTGEEAMAEQIALAAFEKAPTVSNAQYILEKLVPESNDANHLVDAVMKLQKNGGQDNGTAQFIAEWQSRRGGSQAAFEVALQISDPRTRLRVCIPLLEGKPERILRLRQTCPMIFHTPVSCFTDEDWPGFLLSFVLEKPEERTTQWDIKPTLKHYLSYAVNRMEEGAGRDVATKIIKRYFDSWVFSLKVDRDYSYMDLPKPSSVGRQGSLRQGLIKARDTMKDKFSKEISTVHEQLVAKQDLMSLLAKLRVEPLGILIDMIDVFAKACEDKKACRTSHRDEIVSYKCAACRDMLKPYLAYIAILLALRQHEMTKGNPHFSQVGFDGNALFVLQNRGLRPSIIELLVAGVTVEDLSRHPHPDIAASTAAPVVATSSAVPTTRIARGNSATSHTLPAVIKSHPG